MYEPNKGDCILRGQGEGPSHDELHSLDELPVLWIGRCEGSGNAAEVKVLRGRRVGRVRGSKGIFYNVHVTQLLVAQGRTEVTHTHTHLQRHAPVQSLPTQRRRSHWD
jgi:hypothetical protein